METIEIKTRPKKPPEESTTARRKRYIRKLRAKLTEEEQQLNSFPSHYLLYGHLLNLSRQPVFLI